VNIKTSNIILYCNKWKDTVAFYRDVLKFPVHFSNEWFFEFYLSNTARLSVANEENTSIKSSEGKGITVSLEVDDIETVYSFMEGSELNPTPIKEIWESRLFYIYDPEGNRIEFWS
jgi:catechol 2,3-dioxygenase-like lactoylglutathione lyase family enzyme